MNSNPSFEQSACEGKIQYPTLAAAARAAAAFTHDRDSKPHAYACPFCPFFHVGRPRQRKRLRGRRTHFVGNRLK